MYSEFRILIVDDFVLIRTMLKQALIGLGFSNIDEAGDGVEAFERINAAAEISRPYDVVFLDWNMPRMTGFELLQKLKASDFAAELPVIMISAERENSNIILALEAGALDFIAKPFSTATLQAKLQRLLIDEADQSAASGS